MPWSLRSNDFKSSSLKAKVTTCEKKDIILLSFKKLVLFWAVAVFCILLPLVHFVLVPAFVFVGIFVFLAQYKNTHFFSTGEFQCPGCNELNQPKNIYFFESKKLSCSLCGEQLVVLSDQTGA